MNGESVFRFGIVGCGRMGRAHAQRLRADGRGRVVAVCDRPDAVAAAAALRDELAPGAQVFDAPQAMLDGVSLDAAVICTPTTLHFEQVRACRARGVHVLCEKPLAGEREEIAALIDEARGGGPHLAIAYQRRCWSAYRTLRRELRSGRWGAVRAVTSTNTERWQQTISGTWRDDPRVNVGGFIGDAGSHKIDAAFFLTGLRPLEVFARSDRCGSNVEVVTTVSALLEGAVPLHMSFIGNAECFTEDLHVHCSRGDLLLRDGVLRGTADNEAHPVEPLEPDSNPVSAFLDLLAGRAGNFAPADCARPVFEFTQAVRESAREREPVRMNAATLG